MHKMGWLAGVGGVLFGWQVMAELVVSGGAEPATKPAAAAEPAAVVPGAVAEGGDLLTLLNADKLHGTLQGIAAGEFGLKWKHLSAEKAMDFNPASAGNVALAPRTYRPGTPATSTILLSNGDVLPGTLISLDQEKLVLDTAYSGRLNLNRNMVKGIVPGAVVSSVLYEGPNALSEWTVTRGGRRGQAPWRFKNGVLAASQDYPIGRNIEGLPDQVEIQFDASWRNNYPSFYVNVFADNIPDSRNCYMLQISSSIYLQRYSSDNGSSNLGGGQSYEPFNSGRLRQARFTLLADKTKKMFTLLINGALVQQWTEPGAFAGRGNGITFRPSNNGDLRLSRIRVAQWDGKLPEAGGGGGDKVTKEDLVRFINNDKVSGQIKGIANGVMKLETSYATLDVPLARVAEIVTATEKSERARKCKEDIRATFRDKGVLTLQLLRIEKDEIKGKSENFGEITLPLGFLRSLDFNLYQERKAAEGDEEDGESAEPAVVE